MTIVAWTSATILILMLMKRASWPNPMIMARRASPSIARQWPSSAAATRGKRESRAAAVFETSACEFEAVIHIAALCDPPSHDYVGDDTLDHLDCVADFDEDVPEYPGCLGKPGAWVDGGCGIGLKAVLKAAANNKFTRSSVREDMYIKAFERPRRGRHSTFVKEDWDELGFKAEDRAFITQIAKDLHPEYWFVETTEGREWTGDHGKEGELTFMEARHLRNIHDGMEERLGKRGL